MKYDVQELVPVPLRNPVGNVVFAHFCWCIHARDLYVIHHSKPGTRYVGEDIVTDSAGNTYGVKRPKRRNWATLDMTPRNWPRLVPNQWTLRDWLFGYDKNRPSLTGRDDDWQ